MAYLMLLAIAVLVGMWLGYLLGWRMVMEQIAIDSEYEKARQESMRNHPAGKRLWVVNN